jgi:4-hydroxybenzoate polyprenyltransferase
MSTNNKKKNESLEELPSFEQFMAKQEIEDIDKVKVNQVKVTRGIKLAFWFLRIYIVTMVILVIIGFSHI